MRSIVVDDSAAVGARVIALLHDAGALVVGQAADAPHALRLARELGAELVVMDLHVPGMNGFDLAATLKALEPPPLVIVLTNTDANAPLELYRAECERVGVDFVFDKSKDTERVIAAVTTATTRKS